MILDTRRPTPIVVLLVLLWSMSTPARPPIRQAFFNVYPGADGTRLNELLSNASHCGTCHFDFDGGGPRNPYGLRLQTAIGSGLYATTEAAVLAIQSEDSDNDGYSNLVETTDFLGFSNTPTFAGLTPSNLGSVLNVNAAEISAHLIPAGATDTTPPAVAMFWPSGGELLQAGSTHTVQWTASDPSGVVDIGMDFSDDSGLTWKPLQRSETNDGGLSWFVPNLPGNEICLRIVARDGAGNLGYGESPDFTIAGVSTGRVPTTLRDFEMPGTQPFFGGTLEDPSTSCVQCHGNFNVATEPWANWQGSMMAQSQRDPLFLATLAVAEQDAPSVGDLCLRCHTPSGWTGGRSIDTTGGQLLASDRSGVQCDFCHRLVDPVYVPGQSPASDEAILAALAAVPPAVANGNYVLDPAPVKRGPYADAVAAHAFQQTSFYRDSRLCGNCHDVSNPVFNADATPGSYTPGTLDEKHPDGVGAHMMPVERTFSEWTQSAYAAGGVYAPQFAGSKPDGIVSSCQDCHMSDVVGKGCNDNQAPTRSDLPHHDMTGGNSFVSLMIDDFFPGETVASELAAGRDRAVSMLQRAASLELERQLVDFKPQLRVRVTNETGHKLPSGYPEGRRIWLHVRAFDALENVVYESGHYDAATGYLDHDADIKVYHTEPGISQRLGAMLGMTDGPSFHFALNDSIYVDNRIPPRGFANASFASVQASPVGHAYADGQYWDDTSYPLPLSATRVEVALYYQTTSKEYVEFLRDENTTNDWGQDLYDAWLANGRGAPVLMAQASLAVDATDVAETLPTLTRIRSSAPNPFNPMTLIEYDVSASGVVELAVYDVAGRHVRTLYRDHRTPGSYSVDWNGLDDRGRAVASGVYRVRLTQAAKTHTIPIALVR